MISNAIARWSISLVFGTLTTLIIFWFMNYMINSNDNKAVQNSIYKTIDFIALKRDLREPEVKKELPPEPMEQKDPPKIPDMVQESKSSNDLEAPTPLNLDMPSLSGNIGVGGGAPKVLGKMPTPKINSALTPMVQIKPVYPSREKRMGIEGYVKVKLDVDATGHVRAIHILESKPKGAFDKSAKKALKRWRFRPKTVDGKPVAQSGELTLDFKLGDK